MFHFVIKMRIYGRKLRWDFLERHLSDLCRRYSLIVSDHPLPFILIPIIITGICIGGWTFKTMYTNVTELYTPRGAQSRIDQKMINKYFPQKDGTYQPGKTVVYKRECAAVVLARDGGNILRKEITRAIDKLNEYIMNGITVENNGSSYTYQNLCMKADKACYKNPAVLGLGLKFGTYDPFTNLSYPTATIDNQRYYLGLTLGGVTLDPVSKRITDAKAWTLTYKLLESPDDIDKLSRRFEREFEKRLLTYNDPLLLIYVSHSQTLDLEVPRNSETLKPRFTLMLGMLVLFAVLCTLTWSWPSTKNKMFSFPVIDWTISRPVLAFLGVIGAGMGVASAIGLLSYCKMVYNDVVDVMPFLIIAVRLDNTFLMIAALDNTHRTVSVRERISEAMAEAAVSITITVLTDIFSFAFGICTDFLAVQIFCIYTTVAILITWIYQLTFLLACLVYYAKLEERHAHAVVPFVSTVSLEEYESKSILTRIFCLGSHRPASSRPISDKAITSNDIRVQMNKIDIPVQKIDTPIQKHHDDEVTGTAISLWFRDTYGYYLMKTPVKCIVLLCLLIFWSVSILGCMNLRQGLEPVRLLVDDSYAIPYYRNTEKYFWDKGQQVQVVIFNPGDLANASRRQTIFDAIYSFALLPHSTGEEGIDFWMNAFDQYLQQQREYSLRDLPPEKFYDALNYFLTLQSYSRYRVDVSFRNGTRPATNDTNPVVAIRAMVGIKDFASLNGQQETMDGFRSKALSYKELNISTFHMMFLFVDQYEDIWPNVAQEIYSSVACMVAISLLLIPHPICAVWVTLAILSIDVGVIGFMTLWGLNMDTISMITIIMSIGFSVDFSAHIAYAYVVNIQEEPNYRVRKALGTLGWPVLQGGIATILGVIFLANMDSYMIVSFFKTVFLVILFGLMHGLIFLPVLLSLMPKIC